MSEQTLAGLSERLARHEERMNTHQATQEGAMDRMRADMAERDADRDVEMAKRDSDRDGGISALGSAMDRLRADLAERDAEKAKRDAERDAKMAKRDAERDVEMAKRDAERDVEMAKRDKDNTRWMIGLWVATVVVLGAFVTWDL